MSNDKPLFYERLRQRVYAIEQLSDRLFPHQSTTNYLANPTSVAKVIPYCNIVLAKDLTQPLKDVWSGNGVRAVDGSVAEVIRLPLQDVRVVF